MDAVLSSNLLTAATVRNSTGYPRSEIVAPGSSVMLPVQLHSSDPLQVHQAWLVGGQEKAPGTSVIVNGDMTITAKWLLYEVSYLANAPVGDHFGNSFTRFTEDSSGQDGDFIRYPFGMQ